MKAKKAVALLIVFSMSALMTSCLGTGNKDDRSSQIGTTETSLEPTEDKGLTYEFKMFSTLHDGKELSDYNEIQDLITDKTDVRVKEIRAVGTDFSLDALLSANELPDMLYADQGIDGFYEAGRLVAWDEYLEQFPQLKQLYTDAEWDMYRQADGHIYWADVFGRYKDKDTSHVHSGEAFWIQARVLEWGGYPKIETLDQYFDLLENYASANPLMPDGTEVIPYTCLLYYGNAPAMLDGYPNNGCLTVDPDTNEIIDYNTSDTAREYFKKLNSEYINGTIDPKFADQGFTNYTGKLAEGRVLGTYTSYDILSSQLSDSYTKPIKAEDGSRYTLRELGCEYVPLALVSEEGMEQRWHTYGGAVNTAGGIAVTTDCKDPFVVFSFFNALLSPDIMDLRFWGVENVDYLKDANGRYYRTPEMRENWNDDTYRVQHVCEYSCLPQWSDTNSGQLSEFTAGLSEPVKKCFEAYGASDYVEMIGSFYYEKEPWYPLDLRMDEQSLATIEKCRNEWLPKLIMSSDFEADWEAYVVAYEACNPQKVVDEAKLVVE